MTIKSAILWYILALFYTFLGVVYIVASTTPKAGILWCCVGAFWFIMASVAIPFVIKRRRETKELRARIMKEPGGKEWLENFDKW